MMSQFYRRAKVILSGNALIALFTGLAQLAVAPHARAAAGDLFATDLATNSILVYSADGTVRTFATGLDSPQGLAFDSLGNLYVADGGSGTIFKYAADSSRTTFASGLQNPVGLAFVGQELLVAEHGADQVTSLGQDGMPDSSFAIAAPLGVRFANLTGDPANPLNTTWIASNPEADLASSFVQEIFEGNTPPNTFLNGLDPRDIDFTPLPFSTAFATAFVSTGSGTVYGITTEDDGSGGFTNTVSVFATIPAPGIGDLHGLAFHPSVFEMDGTGELFAADTAGGQVYQITPNQPGPGSTVSTFGPAGGQPNYLAFETVLHGKLENISTRAQALTDDNVLIGGFIVTGDSARTVIIRGLGPSLTGMGVPNALADPVMELHDANGLLQTNDNWMDNSAEDQMTIEGNNLAPSSDLESVIVMTLDPGPYTAIVRGQDGGTGVALVEVYDLAAAGAGDSNVPEQLGNISTRGFVDVADNVMIGGFIVGPADGGRVLVRAIGPELSDRGVADALEDTTLELHATIGGVDTIIASNDDWDADDNVGMGEIEATGLAPTDSRESAILANLTAGSYTAIVRGKDGATGVGLVEVYHLP